MARKLSAHLLTSALVLVFDIVDCLATILHLILKNCLIIRYTHLNYTACFALKNCGINKLERVLENAGETTLVSNLCTPPQTEYK
jgi:hypothetical protein